VKIYTKTGDAGDTSLFGGGRVRKSNLRVAAYGDIDELNAALGWLVAQGVRDAGVAEVLGAVQRTLFGVGGEVATSKPGARAKLRDLVDEREVARLESSIDALEERLPALKTFILPGGSSAGAAAHVARTVCRRAERSLVALAEVDELRPEILRYVNRLSDWLFVAARSLNAADGVEEIPW
jgi:cob(I)alamin adenosyltransferase